MSLCLLTLFNHVLAHMLMYPGDVLGISQSSLKLLCFQLFYNILMPLMLVDDATQLDHEAIVPSLPKVTELHN